MAIWHVQPSSIHRSRERFNKEERKKKKTEKILFNENEIQQNNLHYFISTALFLIHYFYTLWRPARTPGPSVATTDKSPETVKKVKNSRFPGKTIISNLFHHLLHIFFHSPCFVPPPISSGHVRHHQKIVYYYMTGIPESARTQSPFSHLYTQVAASHIGDTAAVLISALISHGRLTAKEIHLHSQIPLSQVKTVLVGLVQLRCVQHWTEGKTTFYLFYENGVWALIHAGDILAHINTQYGALAAEVAQHVLENGSVHVREYMGSLGDANSEHATMELLVLLYNDGWLTPVRQVDYQPRGDVWRRVFADTLKVTPRGTSETRRVAEATEKARQSYYKVFEGPDPLQRVNGATVLNPDTTVAINVARYEKRLRTRALTELARSRVGVVTAAIYSRCCALIEAKSPEIGDAHPDTASNDPEERRARARLAENALVDQRATVFLVHDIVRSLPGNLDLRGTVVTRKRQAAAFKRPAKRVKVAGVKVEENGLESDLSEGLALKEETGGENGVSGVETANGDFRNSDKVDYDDADSDDESSAHLLSLVSEHLKLLTSSTIPFLHEIAPGSYTVPFLSLVPWIQRLHYDTLVKTTMGPGALRILNCVRSMKLVDEKAIANAVLMRDRTVKSVLFRLVQLNVLDIQEVPRSADRAALKTFYLFRHKPESLYRGLAHALAFCMADIVAGIASFRLDHAILLEKCAREDVRGHEEELLTELELVTLRDLRVRETGCVGRYNRAKWLYTVFSMNG